MSLLRQRHIPCEMLRPQQSLASGACCGGSGHGGGSAHDWRFCRSVGLRQTQGLALCHETTFFKHAFVFESVCLDVHAVTTCGSLLSCPVGPRVGTRVLKLCGGWAVGHTVSSCSWVDVQRETLARSKLSTVATLPRAGKGWTQQHGWGHARGALCSVIFHKPSASSFLAHSCGAAGLAWADLRGSAHSGPRVELPPWTELVPDSQVPASSAVIRTCCAASGPLCPVKGGLGWCHSSLLAPPLSAPPLLPFPAVQVFGAQEALISTGSTSCSPSCHSQPAPPCLPPFPNACRPELTGRLRPCSGHRPGQTAEPQWPVNWACCEWSPRAAGPGAGTIASSTTHSGPTCRTTSARW
nr:uncharacterized protein LOC121825186 [Peromyscus maniculatus bairdii]